MILLIKKKEKKTGMPLLFIYILDTARYMREDVKIRKREKIELKETRQERKSFTLKDAGSPLAGSEPW